MDSQILVEEWKKLQEVEIPSYWKRAEALEVRVKQDTEKNGIDSVDFDEVQNDWAEIYSELGIMTQGFLEATIGKVRTSQLFPYVAKIDLIVIQLRAKQEKTYVLPDYSTAGPYEIFQKVLERHENETKL